MAFSSAAMSADPPWRQDDRFSQTLNLNSVRERIEGRFLEAGDVLAAAVERIGSLISELSLLSEGPSVQALSAVTGDLARAAAELHALSSGHDFRCQNIADLAASTAAVAGCMDAMRSHLAYLHIYALNIKITSGSILEAGPELISFGQEIEDRIGQGRQQLSAFEDSLSALSTTLDASKVLEEELGRLCQEILPSVPDSLVASADALSAHHARIASLASEVSVTAKDIRSKVGRTLGALQIGDITRQRIEHIEAALAELDQNPDLLAAPAGQRGRVRNTILRLLAAQLSDTARDFHKESGLIGETMDAISQDAAAILRLKDVAVGGADTQSQNVLADLANHVDRALSVVVKTEAGVEAAKGVSRSAVDAARALRSRIGEVEEMRADVELMAFNTSLRCARIGDAGRPLNVIALELRHHADLLKESATLTLTALKALAEGADQAIDTGGADDPSDSGALRLEQAVGAIRGASSALDSQVGVVAEQGRTVVDGLNAARPRLDLRKDLGSILDQALDQLSAAIDHEEPGPEAADRDLIAPLLQRIGASYTMAQERGIHQSVLETLGLGDLEMAKPEAARAAADLEADGLF